MEANSKRRSKTASFLAATAAAAMACAPLASAGELVPAETFKKSTLEKLEYLHASFLDFLSDAKPSLEDAVKQVRGLQDAPDYRDCVSDELLADESDRFRACRAAEEQLNAIAAVPRPRYDILEAAIIQTLKSLPALAQGDSRRWMAASEVLAPFYEEYAHSCFGNIYSSEEGQKKILLSCAVAGRPQPAIVRCEVEKTLEASVFKLNFLPQRSLGEDVELADYERARATIAGYHER